MGLRSAAKLGVGAVVVFGVLDAVLTLLGIRAGHFRELNPLLRMALDAHTAWFLLLKGSLTLLWAGVVIREWRREWLTGASLGIAVGYGVVVARSTWFLAA